MCWVEGQGQNVPPRWTSMLVGDPGPHGLLRRDFQDGPVSKATKHTFKRGRFGPLSQCRGGHGGLPGVFCRAVGLQTPQRSPDGGADRGRLGSSFVILKKLLNLSLRLAVRELVPPSWPGGCDTSSASLGVWCLGPTRRQCLPPPLSPLFYAHS